MQLKSMQDTASQIFGPLSLMSMGLIIVVMANLYLLNKLHAHRSNGTTRMTYLFLNVVILLAACY